MERILRGINTHLNLPTDHAVWRIGLALSENDTAMASSEAIQYCYRSGILTGGYSQTYEGALATSLAEATRAVYDENNAATAYVKNADGDTVAAMYVCPHPHPNAATRIVFALQ